MAFLVIYKTGKLKGNFDYPSFQVGQANNFKYGKGEKNSSDTVKFYLFFSQHPNFFLLPLQSCIFTHINNHLYVLNSKNSIYLTKI